MVPARPGAPCHAPGHGLLNEICLTIFAATSGQHLTVSAAGPDAREAVDALIAILSEATKVGG